MTAIQGLLSSKHLLLFVVLVVLVSAALLMALPDVAHAGWRHA